MKTWYVPITLVEYGRDARVEAETKAEAIEKVRRFEWEELTDAGSFKVTVVGPTVAEEDYGYGYEAPKD